MARNEAELRAYFGTHPPDKRCTDGECVQCEFRDLFEIIDKLRAEDVAMRSVMREIDLRRSRWAPAGTLPFALATALDKLHRWLPEVLKKPAPAEPIDGGYISTAGGFVFKVEYVPDDLPGHLGLPEDGYGS